MLYAKIFFFFSSSSGRQDLLVEFWQQITELALDLAKHTVAAIFSACHMWCGLLRHVSIVSKNRLNAADKN